MTKDDVQFIMVTNYHKHWQGITDSFFTINLIDELVFSILDGSVPTLFIKKYSYKKSPDSWIGMSRYFSADWNHDHTNKIVRFHVTDLQPVDTPQEFIDYKVGWYVNKKNFPVRHLLPEFLSEIENIDKWWLFEKYCHHLLKLIGINNIEPVPLSKNNRGKADGHFIINDLYVLYDATCYNDFMKRKEEKQLKNYIAGLEQSTTVTIAGKQYDLTATEKQIWIITQHDQDHNTFYKSDSLIAKEVPIYLLADIYAKRLIEEINEECLCRLLKNIR